MVNNQDLSDMIGLQSV